MEACSCEVGEPEVSGLSITTGFAREDDLDQLGRRCLIEGCRGVDAMRARARGVDGVEPVEVWVLSMLVAAF